MSEPACCLSADFVLQFHPFVDIGRDKERHWKVHIAHTREPVALLQRRVLAPEVIRTAVLRKLARMPPHSISLLWDSNAGQQSAQARRKHQHALQLGIHKQQLTLQCGTCREPVHRPMHYRQSHNRAACIQSVRTSASCWPHAIAVWCRWPLLPQRNWVQEKDSAMTLGLPTLSSGSINKFHLFHGTRSCFYALVRAETWLRLCTLIHRPFIRSTHGRGLVGANSSMRLFTQKLPWVWGRRLLWQCAKDMRPCRRFSSVK